MGASTSPSTRRRVRRGVGPGVTESASPGAAKAEATEPRRTSDSGGGVLGGFAIVEDMASAAAADVGGRDSDGGGGLAGGAPGGGLLDARGALASTACGVLASTTLSTTNATRIGEICSCMAQPGHVKRTGTHAGGVAMTVQGTPVGGLKGGCGCYYDECVCGFRE